MERQPETAGILEAGFRLQFKTFPILDPGYFVLLPVKVSMPATFTAGDTIFCLIAVRTVSAAQVFKFGGFGIRDVQQCSESPGTFALTRIAVFVVAGLFKLYGCPGYKFVIAVNTILRFIR